MRIAYVAVKGHSIGGGIENLTEEIGSRFVHKGHEIVVYCSRDYGTIDGLYKGNGDQDGSFHQHQGPS